MKNINLEKSTEDVDFSSKLIEQITKKVNIPKYSQFIPKLIEKCGLRNEHSYSAYIVKNTKLGVWIQPYHKIDIETYNRCISNLEDMKNIIHEYHRITMDDYHYSILWDAPNKRFAISRRAAYDRAGTTTIRKHVTYDLLKELFTTQDKVFNNLNDFFNNKVYPIVKITI